MTPTATAEKQQSAPPQGRIFRGRRLDELVGQIRAELGPEAVVLCQREGLVGGVGGFFQQRFYEIEAVAGGPGIDTYEDEPAEPDWDDDPSDEPIGPYANDFAELELTAARADADEVSTGTPAAAASDAAWAERELADSFADRLARAAAAMPTPEPEPAPAPAAVAPSERQELRESPRLRRRMRRREERRQDEPQPVAAPAAAAPAPALSDGVRNELLARGTEPGLAEYLIGTASAHIVPFAPEGGVREAVRSAIVTSLPKSPPPPAHGAALAFVGPGGAGKTCCTAGLASRYASSSTLAAEAVALSPRGGGSELEAMLEAQRIPVVEAQGAQLQQRVATARGGAAVVIDTPAVTPAHADGIAELAAELAPLSLDQTIVTLPATLSLAAARQLLHALAPLNPTALAITHVDETDQLGVAISLACETGLPIAYVHWGIDLPGALAPADLRWFAEVLLP